MNIAFRIRDAVFSAATVLALGFGAAQAFAAPPAPRTDAASMQACDWVQCSADCRRRGYFGGYCDSFNGTTYCTCTG